MVVLMTAFDDHTFDDDHDYDTFDDDHDYDHDHDDHAIDAIAARLRIHGALADNN